MDAIEVRHSKKEWKPEEPTVSGRYQVGLDDGDPMFHGGLTTLKVKFNADDPDFSLSHQVGYSIEEELEAKVSEMIANRRAVEIQETMNNLAVLKEYPDHPDKAKMEKRNKEVSEPYVFAWRHIKILHFASEEDGRLNRFKKGNFGLIDEVHVVPFKNAGTVNLENSRIKPIQARNYDGQKRQIIADWRIVS